MGDNRLRHTLQAGGTIFGSLVSLPEPGIVEIVGAAGYDFVLIDMEHTPIGFGQLRNMLVAADAAQIVPVVRVGTTEANPILRVLDMGASGVVAAHVRSREEAIALVKACRYPPQGSRGVSGASRAAGYGKVSFPDHVHRSNMDVLTIALIEDQEGVEAIDDIVSVEGLDVVLPGPGDLSASMGLIGQAQHPDVLEAVGHIVATVKAQPGLVLAYHLMDAGQLQQCLDLGVRMIIFSQDSRVAFQAYRSALQEMKRCAH